MIINTNSLTASQARELQKTLVEKAGPVAPGRGEVHIDNYLTQLSVAVMQDSMGFVADKFAPPTPVAKQSNKIAVIDRTSYTRDVAEARAPGAESVGTGHKVLDVTYDALVYALHEDVDDQTRANYDQPLDADDDAMFVLDELMKINKELNFVRTAFSNTAWASYVVGATATDTNFNPSSSTAAHHNMLYLTDSAASPIQRIKQLKRHVMLRGGREPNALCLGMELYDNLCEHDDIVGRVNRGQSPGEPAQATEMDLARLFGLDYVWPMKGIYNAAQQGQTGNFQWIGNGKSGLLGYVNPMGGGLRMPQGMRTLTWNGYLGATQQGTRVQKYRMQHLASDRIEYEAAYDHMIIDNGMAMYLNGVTP